MATATIDNDVDIMACGVCFHRFDLENRKPKFLQCSHTLCLSCVKGILKEGNIRCPFCRLEFSCQNAEILTNNNYATQILMLVEKNKRTSSETTSRKKASISWCTTCQSAEKSLCAALGHSTIKMTSKIAKNIEQQMFQVRTELEKLKDQGIHTLAQVIQKRRLIEERLSLIMKSIHFAEEEVKKLQDDNNLQLTKVMSIMDLTKQPVSAYASIEVQEEKDDFDSFISELMPMIEDFDPDDTIDILKCKMKKTLGIYTKYLQEATSTASCYNAHEKNRTTVIALNSEGERPNLIVKFAKNNRSEQDVPHSILSVLDEKDLLTTLKSLLPTNSITSRIIRTNSFVLGQSIFILKVYAFNTVIDELWIQPCVDFNNEFMQQLGMYCYNSPMELEDSFKAMKDVYVVLSGEHDVDAIIDLPLLSYSPFATRALEFNEVGLQYEWTEKHTNSETEFEWELIFPLHNFEDCRYEMHVKNYKAGLFGKLIKRNTEILTELSSTLNAERTSVAFTLESV